MLIMKFKKHNNLHSYKWETNYWIHSILNVLDPKHNRVYGPTSMVTSNPIFPNVANEILLTSRLDQQSFLKI